MQKVYNRINWENYPSEATPLNETNLNRTDYAINEIDNRVISLDTTKLSVTDANNLIKGIAIDNETGVITVMKNDNSTITLNTNLSKIATNWTYNQQTQQIVLTQSDGTLAYINLSSLIQQNEFIDSASIAFTISNGNVTATVKAHSIGDNELRTDYLADIRTSEANAYQSELDAEASSILSKSWAVGDTNNSRPGEATDNSKYYAQVAQNLKTDMVNLKEEADAVLEQATTRLTGLTFMLNFTDGNLYYDINVGIDMQIDTTTGNLMWEVIV
jgi:hypothetical protein